MPCHFYYNLTVSVYTPQCLTGVRFIQVTDVEHMAYMERLGLWGKGTQFDSFGDFQMCAHFKTQHLVVRSTL